MAYKILIVDDKKVKRELMDGLIDGSENAVVFDNISKTVPIPELTNKLKKAYEFVAIG